MARRKNKQQEEDTLVDVVGQVENLQDYVEQNRNTIMAAIIGIILVVASILAYLYIYKAPRDKAASEKIHHAQFAFDQGNWEIALEGDTINTDQGFLDIIDAYSGTQTANLAHYYAGVCYLNIGDFDTAISYFEDYREKGKVLPSFKFANLGDAYSEKGELDKALSFYKKAVAAHPNEFSTPMHLMKLGLLYEKQGQKADAKETYQRIADKYPNSLQAVDAEKYLTRVGG